MRYRLNTAGPGTEAQIPGGTSAELHCCCLLLLWAARAVNGTSRDFRVPGDLEKVPSGTFSLLEHRVHNVLVDSKL